MLKAELDGRSIVEFHTQQLQETLQAMEDMVDTPTECMWIIPVSFVIASCMSSLVCLPLSGDSPISDGPCIIPVQLYILQPSFIYVLFPDHQNITATFSCQTILLSDTTGIPCELWKH